MTIRHLRTPIMHRVVERNGMIFVGGTTCDDESLDMAGQTREILTKIDSYLAQAGSDKSKLLSATIFVTDLGKKPDMDAVWKEWLPAEALPTRATVGVADLGGTTMIEIVVTAHI
ncbi:enamine deaminase RidA (YjgF/YER057c/UK114 family) [Azospirillum lipoferum]|uniref:RidA family protein n=1 Tax=Azospirillum lipoferum TaxID=193 RepID=A0A5A9GQC1_AZOLI|nr:MULTISPECIES: RidA family protein [Azospirillum]KAA0595982.1 RidA family protein [Azospirillum lipoferum]MCP1610885.1 enamine deaminase RidA (YjgF/YER057c/UK114 family) [Azospirillum lipoferum]MDW5533968.1 RidA family protein [Azospirillum sp. NL1]